MVTRFFPGRYESLAAIAEFVRLESKKAGLTFKDIFEIETAVDEAVSNIIEHAYGGEGIGEIACSCISSPDKMTIILEDHGMPFDPACIPVPDITANLEERENHGLGYFLMCRLMDDIHFEFREGLNQLTMVKRKTQ
jgi:serine/threonine-protein kinase RsbW